MSNASDTKTTDDITDTTLSVKPEFVDHTDNNDCKSSDDFTDTQTSVRSELEDHTVNDDSNDSGIYYFESDHVALRSNPDYQSLLQTISLLESQRIQAIKDLDKLHEGQEKALQDPIGFVECLQNGKQLDLPKFQHVATLPTIDWEKYTSNVQFTSFGVRHMTRLKKQLVHGTTDEELKSNGTTSTSYFPNTEESDVRVVRGRIKTDSKPSTFNLLWTVEEQKRLEELLVTYPPEEVEVKRWQKIADALGNRTVQQVASRVQKYFIKLTKAGLPVPGRIPNLNAYNKKQSSHRNQRYNKMYHQSSTFLHAFEPPVYMSDDDEDFKTYDDDSLSVSQWNQSPEVSDEEDVPPELRCTPEYHELLKWKMIKRERQNAEDKMVHHVGYKCDNCDREPIVGTRWHCVDCPEDSACDFCDDCVNCVFESGTHNTSHRLKPVKQAGNPTIDQDYVKFMPGDYNYLDPNYMPAS